MKKVNTGIHTLYVANLRFTMDEGQILGLFKKYGYIKNIKMLKEGKEDKFKGVAFVDMVNMADVKEAIENLNGTEHYGRTIKVSLANTQNFNEETVEEKKFTPKKSKSADAKFAKATKKQNPKHGLEALFANTRSK